MANAIRKCEGESSPLLGENEPNIQNRRVTSQASGGGACELNTLIDGGCGDNGVRLNLTSLNITSHRIVIDRGTYLAKLPHHINSDWCINSSTGNELLDYHISGLFEFINAKRRTKSKANLLDCIMANLFSAYNTNSQLLYSRNKSSKDYVTIIQIIDYLEHNQLIINVIGRANEYQGNASWMYPTDKLKSEFERAKVKVELAKDASMVIVRDKGGNEKQLSRIKTRQPLQLREASNPVQEYNQAWLNHDVTLYGNHLIPFCRRIYNEDLNHGGRFYGASHLVLPKAERQFICIDGAPTIEPDFKSIHYCLLYALEGTQLNPLIDDPYLIDGFSRKTIKLASLVLLNSEDLSRFKANVTKSGKPENKATMQRYSEEMTRFIMRSGQCLPCTQPVKPKLSQGFIAGMPDHINGGDLLNAIKTKHSLIAHKFGSDRIGVKLQNLDSRIVARSISILCAQSIVCLPVHDSLRCKNTDVHLVVEAMERAYKAEMNFNGCVTLD